MDIRYFRHLFECDGNGIIQTGSLWDKLTDEQITYVYIAGSYDTAHARSVTSPRIRENAPLDICVLGAYTYSGIVSLLKYIEARKTKTVILPYVSPIQRLFLANQVPTEGLYRKELIEFFDDPNRYIMNMGVEEVYFLYGNGKPLQNEPENHMVGYHFEQEDPEIMRLIHEMEGRDIPVVKSGYILTCQWLFYFGTFGPDLLDVRAFVEEEIAGKRTNGDYQELGRVLQAFRRRFGSHPYSTVLMYHSSINDAPQDNDILMTCRPFGRERGCKSVIPRDGSNCALQCQHDYDYEMFRYHLNKKHNVARMGILLLGNVELKRYFVEVSLYFGAFFRKIRAVSVPGVHAGWDKKILKCLSQKDYIYFILPVSYHTGSEAVTDILTASASYRLVNIRMDQGYCMCGYLICKETPFL